MQTKEKYRVTFNIVNEFNDRGSFYIWEEGRHHAMQGADSETDLSGRWGHWGEVKEGFMTKRTHVLGGIYALQSVSSQYYF